MSAQNEHVIRLRIDRSAAQAAYRQHSADVKQADREAKEHAKAVERLLKESARVAQQEAKARARAERDANREVERLLKESARVAQQEAKARARAERDANREVERLLKESAREKVRAERDAGAATKGALKDAERAAKEMARERARVAKQSAQEQAKAAREAAAEMRRIDNRRLTDAEVAERAQAEAFRRLNRDRIKAEADAIAPAHRRIGLTDQWAASLQGVVAGYAGLDVGARVLDRIGEASDRAQKHAEDLARALQQDIDKQREYQGIIGGRANAGSSVAMARKRLETLASPDEDLAFRTALTNRAAQHMGDGKSLTAEGGQRFGDAVEAFAIAKGIPVADAGEAGGAVLGMKDYGGDDRRAAADVAQMVKGLSAGAGDYNVLLREANQVAGTLATGPDARIRSHKELAAMISLGAEMDPGRAGTFNEQLARAISPSATDKQKGLIRGAEIGDRTSFVEAIPKLKAAIEAEAKAGGTTLDAVINKHFANYEEGRAVKLAITKGPEVVADRMKAMDAYTPEAMDAEMAAMRADPEGPLKERERQRQQELANFEVGRRNLATAAAKDEARTRLTRKGYFSGGMPIAQAADDVYGEIPLVGRYLGGEQAAIARERSGMPHWLGMGTPLGAATSLYYRFADSGANRGTPPAVGPRASAPPGSAERP